MTFIVKNSDLILDNLDNLSESIFFSDNTHFNNFISNYFILEDREISEKDFIYIFKGEGSYGNVFLYKDKVVKIFSSRYRHLLLDKGDNYYLIDSNIMEGISTIYFNQLIKDYTPCSFNIHGVYITNIEKDIVVSIVMDELNIIPLEEFIENKIFILFLIIHALYIGQNKCRIIHGDFEERNIMSKPYIYDTIKIKYNEYNIELQNKLGWLPVITDFGFSSFDYKNRRYFGEITNTGTDRSSYNQYCDIATLYQRLLLISDVYGNHLIDDLDYIFLEDPFQTLNKQSPLNEFIDNIRLRSTSDILNSLLERLDHKKTKSDYVMIPYIDPINDFRPINIDSYSFDSNMEYRRYKFDDIQVSKVSVPSLLPNGYSYKNSSFCVNTFDFISEPNSLFCINGTFFHENDIDIFTRCREIENYCKENNCACYFNGTDIISIKDGYETIQNISPLYKLFKRLDKHYGVVIVQDKEIKIEEFDGNFLNPQYNGNSFVAGPLLVFNRQIRILEYEKESLYEEYYKYGLLNNMLNSCKRSILATTEDNTLFITLDNANVNDIVNFLKNLNVINAICLNSDKYSSLCLRTNKGLFSDAEYRNRRVLPNVLGVIKE